jgi:hypothetical protein
VLPPFKILFPDLNKFRFDSNVSGFMDQIVKAAVFAFSFRVVGKLSERSMDLLDLSLKEKSFRQF